MSLSRRNLYRNFSGPLTRSRAAFMRQQLGNLQRYSRNLMFARGRTMTLQRRGRNTRGGQGVTNQYDKALIYRRRRMPRRRRRRWRRWNRKVLQVSEKDLGSRTSVFNSLVTVQASLSVANQTTQSFQAVALYPMVDGGSSHMNDVSTMSTDTSLSPTGKFIFKSAVIDLTVRNISSRLDEGGNPPITLEVDLYEIVTRKVWNTGIVSIGAAFNNAMADTDTIPGRAVALSRDSRGWTPWDAPSAISEFGFRILKKTKFFLGENQVFTYQFRDPKRHVLDYQSIPVSQQLPGFTRYFVFIFKPTPGYAYTDPPVDTYGISIGVTRKYLYKIKDSTQDYDAYGN